MTMCQPVCSGTRALAAMAVSFMITNAVAAGEIDTVTELHKPLMRLAAQITGQES